MYGIDIDPDLYGNDLYQNGHRYKGRNETGAFSATELLLDLCRVTDLYVMAPVSESDDFSLEQ